MYVIYVTRNPAISILQSVFCWKLQHIGWLRSHPYSKSHSQASALSTILISYMRTLLCSVVLNSMTHASMSGSRPKFETKVLGFHLYQSLSHPFDLNTQLNVVGYIRYKKN
jgi:hypothetical protein